MLPDRKGNESAPIISQKSIIAVVTIVLVLSISLLMFGFPVYNDSTMAQPHLVPVAPNHHCVNDNLSNEQKYQEWFASYEAPNPINTEYCKGVMMGKRQSQERGSQFEQDMFLFHNLFKYWPMNGKKGVYLDSGANAAIALSNTYFFDVCLGWEGVCVEPETMYHEDLKKHRSCKLVPTCLGSKEETISFADEGVGGHQVAAGKGRTITCQPLEKVLQDTGHGKLHVDLWSLDVEGFEMHILESLNFDKVSISAVLIEDFWLSQRGLDILMTKNGFLGYQKLTIDSVYVNRYFQNAAQKVFYPPNWDEYHKQNMEWAKTPGVKNKLIW
jgi:FkbM family methyltransferase